MHNLMLIKPSIHKLLQSEACLYISSDFICIFVQIRMSTQVLRIFNCIFVWIEFRSRMPSIDQTTEVNGNVCVLLGYMSSARRRGLWVDCLHLKLPFIPRSMRYYAIRFEYAKCWSVGIQSMCWRKMCLLFRHFYIVDMENSIFGRRTEAKA